MAGEGTWQSEESYFLVDSNGDGGQQEQLAQQLLAFIFNTQHCFGDNTSAGIQLPDGSYSNNDTIIEDAINAWLTGGVSEWTTHSSLLDAFNNNDAVNYVPFSACAVNY